jgi:hypothetical protein
MIENITEGFIAGARKSARAKNEEGYILLFPEPQTIEGAKILFAYYVKKSDFPIFPIGLKEDEDRRVYCFIDIYNKETDELVAGPAIKLSKKASGTIIEEWFWMLHIKATALDVINECLKY